MNIYQRLVVVTTGTAVSFAVMKANPVQAASIIQDQTNGAIQILHASSIGQTFTAEDAFIESIGFSIADFSSFGEDVNSSLVPNDFSITVKLYEGIGTNGTLVGSGVFNQLFDDFNGWADVDFTSVVLNVGNTYTAIVEDENFRWGVEYFDANAYLGGHVLSPSGRVGDAENVDLRFRVLVRETPTPTSVPEPGTVAGLSLLGLSLFLKKKVES